MMENTILGGAPAPVENSNNNPAPAPAANSSPAPVEWGKLCSDNGALADNWKEFLPEGLRDEACLANYHTFPALVQSLVSAQHAVGVGKVAIPTDKSTPEELAAFYKAGGRPDSADGYDFSKVELPEGVKLDDEMLANFKKFAFENGISAKAANALLGFDIARVQAQRTADEAAAQSEYDATLARIQQEHGGDWRSYLNNCKAILNAAPGLKKVFEAHGLMNNYEVVNFLATMGAASSESTIKGLNGGIQNSSIEEQIAQMQQPGSAFMDSGNPGHDVAVQKMIQLISMRK